MLALQRSISSPNRELSRTVDTDSSSRNLVARLNAALHGLDCGLIVCSSPEQAIALLLHGKPRAGMEPLPRDSGFGPFAGSNGEARRPEEPERSLLTLLFTDIVDSTGTAERLGDESWHTLLVRHHAIVRSQLATFRGREIDKAGDGFFATFDRPSRAVACAHAIRSALAAIGIEIRAGVHIGECETVGAQVSGVAVHVAARVASIAQPGEILVSSAVRDVLAGSRLEFSRGDWHDLKGLSGSRQLYALCCAAGAAAGSQLPQGS